MTAPSKSALFAKIISGRKRHGLAARDLKSWDSNMAREGEKKLGMPAHGARTGSAISLIFGGAIGRKIGIDYDDWLELSGQHVLALLDGYLLAEAVMGPAKVLRTFKTPGAFTRFAGTAAGAGDALLASPVGDTVRALVEDLTRRFRPALKKTFTPLMSNAIAAGVLLYATERELEHPTFAGVRVQGPLRLEKASAPPREVEASPELMAAIIAAPFDDRPRLVYADWLTEQHDPLGLFIQLQCGPASPDAEERAKALITRNQKTWVAPIRKIVRQWKFARGFVNWVVADFELFLKHQAELKKVPLLNAKLTAYLPELLTLADAAPHPSIVSLDLSNNRLTAKTVGLFARPFFSRAIALDLGANRLREQGFVALVDALPKSVRRLSLTYTDLTSVGLATLSRWSGFGALTHLDLRYNRELDDAGLAILEGARELRHLVVGMGILTAAGIEQLARLRLPKLERLVLYGKDVGGLEAFLKTRTLPSLVTLDLPYSTPAKIAEKLEARFPPKPWENAFEL